MDPIHWERGKYYYVIKCQNPECHQTLALVEVPARPSPEEEENLWKQIEGRSVRCPICSQETPIEQRKLFVLDVQQ